MDHNMIIDVSCNSLVSFIILIDPFPQKMKIAEGEKHSTQGFVAEEEK